MKHHNKKKHINEKIRRGEFDDLIGLPTHHLIICPHCSSSSWKRFSANLESEMSNLFRELDEHLLGKKFKRKKKSRTKYFGNTENHGLENPHIHVALVFNQDEIAAVSFIKKYFIQKFNFFLIDVKIEVARDNIEEKRELISYVMKDYAYNSLVKREDSLFISNLKK